MIAKEKAVSIDYDLINSGDLDKIYDMFFKVLSMEGISIINREFKDTIEVDEEVTMRVVIELDKRKV